MSLLVVVLACFAAAALAPRVVRRAGPRRAALAAAAFAAGVGVWFAAQAPTVVRRSETRAGLAEQEQSRLTDAPSSPRGRRAAREGRTTPTVLGGRAPELVVPWVPRLGVDLALRLDGLALLFALLVTWLGAAILAYAGAYLGDHPQAGRFHAYMLSFMGAMLGVALADDLVTLYVFYELTTVASFLLIALEHEEAEARRAATQAFLLTTAGGLCLLAALVLIQQTTGTLRLSALGAHADALRAGPYAVIVVLVLVAASTKSAQVPLHPWLPAAMVAPTPVSAYLHAAAMVKVGLLVLARLSPALGGTTLWTVSLTLVGGVTATAGAWIAVRQTDLKRLLAYSTISALGLLTLMLGVGGEAAATAFLAYLVAHALYKSALFMVAGAIDHGAGTRDLGALGGLARAAPALALVAALAAWSFAGAPGSLGFVGKELLYEAALDAGALAAAAVLVASAGMTVAAGLTALRPFRRRDGVADDLGRDFHKRAPGRALCLAPAACAVAGLVLGVRPGLLDPLLGAASAGLLGRPAPTHLAAWHGPTPELALGALGLLAGAAAYLGWERLRDGPALATLDAALGRGPGRAYDRAVEGTRRLAAASARRVRTDDVRAHVAAILLVLVALGGAALVRAGGLERPTRAPLLARDWLVVALLVVALGAACRAPVRFRTIITLSAAGYATALLYQTYGAPDVALVQVLVETLVVILFILALGGMPRSRHAPRPQLERARDAALALGAGAVVLAAMLLVLAQPFDGRIGLWYGLEAHELARGRNVVNAVLVDFRALDTLGEATVIVLASLGVWVLLEAETTPRAEEEEAPSA